MILLAATLVLLALALGICAAVVRESWRIEFDDDDTADSEPYPD